MPDLGEEKNVSDEKAKAGRVGAERKVVWRTLLSDVRGRKFCWWLLTQGHIYSSSYRGEDTHAMVFLEGQRALMIPIQGEMIRSNPADYQKMVIEHAAMEIEDGRTDS